MVCLFYQSVHILHILHTEMCHTSTMFSILLFEIDTMIADCLHLLPSDRLTHKMLLLGILLLSTQATHLAIRALSV